MGDLCNITPDCLQYCCIILAHKITSSSKTMLICHQYIINTSIHGTKTCSIDLLETCSISADN
jgi:hypothetical protein